MTILYHCNNIMYTFFVYTVMNELKKKIFFIILATQFSTIKKKNFEKRKRKRKEKKRK